MANELSLSVWWLMWAELVYLLAYLQKRNFPYVSGSYIIYYVYIKYIVHTATYTQHQGIKYVPSNYVVLSYNDKSHSWPFLQPGSEVTGMPNTAAQERVKGDDRLTAALLTGLGIGQQSLRSSRAGKWACNYWLYPLHYPRTATTPCSLPPVDATLVLTLYDAWWNHSRVVGKQKTLCISEPCHMNHSWKYRFFLDHLTPSLGLFSLSSL